MLWALAAVALWGTLAAVVGDALAGLPAATLLFWSFLFAAPTLLIADRLRGIPLRRQLAPSRRAVGLGLWGIFGYHAFLFEALAHAPIVQANLLNYLWPLLIVVLAPAIARERPNHRALLGAAVGFAGAALVVTQGRAVAISGRDALGYALAALAAVSWSTFSLLLRRWERDAKGRMPLFVTVALAASFVYAVVRGQLFVPDARALAAAAWLGIGPMALAFLAWDKAMATTSPARVGALSYLDPLLSTICVAVALHRHLSVATVVGMVLLIAGAAVGSRKSP